MSVKIREILPTDVIADSRTKINENFKILANVVEVTDGSVFAQLDLLAQEYEGLKEAIATLRAEIDSSEDNLEIISILQLLAQKNVDFERALAQLRAEISDSDSDILTQLQMLSERYGELSRAIATLTAQIESNDYEYIFSQLTLLTSKDAEMEQAISRLKSEILSNDYESIISELELKATKGDIDEAIARLRAEILTSDMESIMSQLQLRVTRDELTQALAELMAEIDFGDSDSFGTIKSQLTLLAQEDGRLWTSLADLRAEIESSDSDGYVHVLSELKLLSQKAEDRLEALAELMAEIESSDSDGYVNISSRLKMLANQTAENKQAWLDLSSQVDAHNASITSELSLKVTYDELARVSRAVNELKAVIDDSDGDLVHVIAELKQMVESSDGGFAQAITELNTAVEDVRTSLSQTVSEVDGVSSAMQTLTTTVSGHSASISQMVTKTSDGIIESSVTLDADKINLNASHKLNISGDYMTVNTSNFKLDSDGNVTVTGTINATQGSFGKLFINGSQLYLGRSNSTSAPSNPNTWFDSNGILHCSGAVVSGSIYAEYLEIGSSATSAITSIVESVGANNGWGGTTYNDDWLTTAFSKTQISGGLVTTGNLLLKEGNNYTTGILGAGVSTSDNNGKIKIFAGTSFSNDPASALSSNVASAPFRVYDNGKMVATNAVISGTIMAGAGSVGNVDITSDGLFCSFDGCYTLGIMGDGVENIQMCAGTVISDLNNLDAVLDAPFRVYNNGKLVATDAEISGTISANAGSIGGITINSSGISASHFSLTSSGRLNATNAVISGTITATSGSIGGITISGGGLSAGNGDFSLTSSGILTAKGAVISGTITANSGSIGGVTISGDGLFIVGDGDDIEVGIVGSGDEGSRVESQVEEGDQEGSPVETDSVRIYAGGNSNVAPFKVYNTGRLVATNAVISGTITAGAGSIGGITINSSGISASRFSLTNTGHVNATDISISSNGFVLNSNTLTMTKGSCRISVSSGGIEMTKGSSGVNISTSGIILTESSNKLRLNSGGIQGSNDNGSHWFSMTNPLMLQVTLSMTSGNISGGNSYYSPYGISFSITPTNRINGGISISYSGSSSELPDLSQCVCIVTPRYNNASIGIFSVPMIYAAENTSITIGCRSLDNGSSGADINDTEGGAYQNATYDWTNTYSVDVVIFYNDQTSAD